MSFPTEPVRSLGWFDNCFEGAQPSMPLDLRRFSEAVCDRFDISGICDPMYIANVAAYELGRGDGCSHFDEPGIRQDFEQRRERVAQRLSHAYSSCIGNGVADLRTLARTLLKPPAGRCC